MPHRVSILIVDDTSDNRELLSDVFVSEGFRVVTASSVEAARSVLLKSQSTFDLVLSDISMPRETGFDLISWMRGQIESIYNTPVLLITAVFPEDEHRIRGLSLGAVDYIVRPISNRELVLRVRNAIEHFRKYQALQTSLESSEDLAMTGRILAAANHEIRNLTGLILLTSERAMYAAQSSDAFRPDSLGFECMQALHQSARLLAEVSRGLNSYVGKDLPKLCSVELQSVIQEVVRLVRSKMIDVLIDTEQSASEDYVLADATRLKQILINFLLNASDAMEERGLNSVQGHIVIRIVEAGPNQVAISVKDNGIGLPKADTRREFIPFRTTKSVKGGKGLGLWLCQRLATEMKGYITLESAGPLCGATAKVALTRTVKPIGSKFDVNIEDFFVDSEKPTCPSSEFSK